MNTTTNPASTCPRCNVPLQDGLALKRVTFAGNTPLYKKTSETTNYTCNTRSVGIISPTPVCKCPKCGYSRTK